MLQVAIETRILPIVTYHAVFKLRCSWVKMPVPAIKYIVIYIYIHSVKVSRCKQPSGEVLMRFPSEREAKERNKRVEHRAVFMSGSLVHSVLYGLVSSP